MGRACCMRFDHQGIVRIDDRRLRRSSEQLAGMGHVVLIECVFSAYQHANGMLLAATGPAGLLPEGSQGSRERIDYGRVQVPDIDPELESIGGRDAEQIAGKQGSFDSAAVCRKVAAPVRGNTLRQRLLESIFCPREDQLGRFAAPREHDRVLVIANQVDEEVGGLGHRAAATARSFFDQRRVPKSDQFCAVRRIVARQDLDLQAAQSTGQLTGLPIVAEANTRVGSAP